MGNGVKALLVALLIISVVIAAKLVQDKSDPAESGDPSGQIAASGAGENGGAGGGALVNTNPGSTPSDARTSRTPPSRAGSGVRSSTKTAAQLRRERALAAAKERARQADEGEVASGGALTGPRGGRPATRTPFNPRSNRDRPSSSAEDPASPVVNPPTPTKKDDGDSEEVVQVQIKPSQPGAGADPYEEALPGTGPVGPRGERRSPLVTSNIRPGAGSSAQESPAPGTTNRRSGFATSNSSLEEIQEGTASASPAPSPRANGGTGSFRTPIQGRSSKPTPPRSTPSAPPARSAVTFPHKHVVQNGESYWRIAEKFYGISGAKYYRQISRANAGRKLIPGLEVTVPAPPARGETAKPSSVPAAPRKPSARPAARRSADGKYYLHPVVKGDTLSGLALKYYRNPRNYSGIIDANLHLRFTELRIGEVVKVPVKP